MTPNDAQTPMSDVYLAATIEKKITGYKGHMPESEKKILARNLGELLSPRKVPELNKAR